MSDIYSQGFSFGGFVHEGVDPRTGQFSCTVDVYEVPSGARNCPPLKLKLTYNMLSSQNIGFGKGWSLNLSTYDHRAGKALYTSAGEHFQVSESASSVELKDQKLKGLSFAKKDDGKYHLVHKSGQVEVLDNQNDTLNLSVPVKIFASNGRSLDLSWSCQGEQPRLTSIKDGTVELLRVEYTDSGATVTQAPGASEEAVYRYDLKNDRLVEIALPLDDSPPWKFTYITLNSFSCLSTVVSPSGLIEEVQYKRDGHRMPPRAPYTTVPYAISHVRRPGSGQPATTSTYAYSDHNFLGYGSGRDWKAGEDNIYHCPGEYRYKNTHTVHGGDDGEGGPVTEFTYNKYHLTDTIEKTVNDTRLTHNYVYYADTDEPFDRQVPQYQLPKRIETVYQDLSTEPSRARTETHVQEFDEWGNPTREILPTGVEIRRCYYPQSGESDGCPADPHGFQRYLKTETLVPASTANGEPTRSHHYRYRSVAISQGNDMSVSHCVVLDQSTAWCEGSGEPQSVTTRTYVEDKGSDDICRIAGETSVLNGKYETTKMYYYSYSGDKLLHQGVLTGFDGQSSRESCQISMYTGRTLSQNDRAGIDFTHEYNSLGDIVKATRSPGTKNEAVYELEYSLADIENEKPAQVVVTNTNGIKQRRLLDGLGRIVSLQQQDYDQVDIDGSKDEAPYRETLAITYDNQGRTSQRRISDWLRTSTGSPERQTNTIEYDYDDWGQVCSLTSSGVKTVTKTDMIDLTIRRGLEGECYTEFKYNVFGSPTSVARYHPDNRLESETTSQYDGLGRILSSTDAFKATIRYSYDKRDRVTEVAFPDGSKQCKSYADYATASAPTILNLKTLDGSTYTLGTQMHDSFLRVKNTESGGRESSYTYQDNCMKPSSITNPLKDIHNFQTDQGLDDVTTLSSTDSITQTFSYDPKTAWLLEASEGANKTTNEYYPSGLLKAQSETLSDGNTVHDSSCSFQYSFTGKLQRLQDDVGNLQSFQYDECGRLCSINDTLYEVTISYDKKGRQSLISTKDKNSSTTVNTILQYDDFGRPSLRELQSNGVSIWEMRTSYNAADQVTERRLIKGGAISRVESYDYDWQRRLSSYTCTGDSAPKDENGRKIKKQAITYDKVGNIDRVTNTFIEQAQGEDVVTYTYGNPSDPFQLTAIVGTNPNRSSSLVYDAAGRVTQDEHGRTLSYDGLGRLTKVDGADGTNLSQYYYDPHKLKGQKYNGVLHHLRYRGLSLVGESTASSQTRYLRVNGTIVACNQKDDNGSTSTLTGTDFQGSLMTTIESSDGKEKEEYIYDPFGAPSSRPPFLGFHGERLDPATGNYLLGGYRAYDPLLRAFQAPDSMSPFGAGGINPYSFCLDDPINRTDPSGHFSIFGLEFGWRDVAVIGAGIGATIGLAILTGGVSLVVELGVGILASVAAGATYDLASGKTPSWQSVGMDALAGGVGVLGGAVVGKALSVAGKAVFKTAEKGLVSALGRTASYDVAGAFDRAGFKSLYTTLHDSAKWIPERWEGGKLVKGRWENDLLVFFNRLDGQEGTQGILTHGVKGENMLCGLDEMGTYKAMPTSRVVHENILPAIETCGTREPHEIFNLIACGEGPLRQAHTIANILKRPVRAWPCTIKLHRLDVGFMRTFSRALENLEQPGFLNQIISSRAPVIVYPEAEAATWIW
ncbi:hypothetical protein TWF281_003836 [Arthrobotrys megalospora]